MRKKNRKVVADKEKTLKEEYRGIMEGRREVKIPASPTADIVPPEEATQTKAAQKNLSHHVGKQVSAPQQGGSWGGLQPACLLGGCHTPTGLYLARRVQAQPCGKLLIIPL